MSQINASINNAQSSAGTSETTLPCSGCVHLIELRGIGHRFSGEDLRTGGAVNTCQRNSRKGNSFMGTSVKNRVIVVPRAAPVKQKLSNVLCFFSEGICKYYSG